MARVLTLGNRLAAENTKAVTSPRSPKLWSACDLSPLSDFRTQPFSPRGLNRLKAAAGRKIPKRRQVAAVQNAANPYRPGDPAWSPDIRANACSQAVQNCEMTWMRDLILRRFGKDIVRATTCVRPPHASKQWHGQTQCSNQRANPRVVEPATLPWPKCRGARRRG